MLDRFHFGPEERWPIQYAAYRSNPSWRHILKFLRRECYWHVTTKDAWREIRKSGAIMPNVDGRFSMRFDTISERSFGYINKCVSLFDFLSPSEEQLIRQWGNVHDVLTDTTKTMILLALRWQSLHSMIVPNSQCWNPESGSAAAGCIPFCEVWYPGEIPISVIEVTYLLSPCSDLEGFNPGSLFEDDDLGEGIPTSPGPR